MNEEDDLVKRCLKLDAIDRINLIKQHLIHHQLPLVRTSIWAYEECFKNKQEHTLIDREIFANQFIESWFKFFSLICERDIGEMFPIALKNKDTLFISSHTFDYPKLAPNLLHENIKVLVARKAYWISRISSESQLINFRKNQLKKLIRSFQNRESIFTMLDYCYDETKSEYSLFLGKKCKTPYGIIELALKYKYEIAMIHRINGRIILKNISTYNKDSIQIIDEINEEFTAIISSNPTNWLLWPSINRRWKTVDQ